MHILVCWRHRERGEPLDDLGVSNRALIRADIRPALATAAAPDQEFIRADDAQAQPFCEFNR